MFSTMLGKFEDVRRVFWHALRIAELECRFAHVTLTQTASLFSIQERRHNQDDNEGLDVCCRVSSARARALSRTNSLTDRCAAVAADWRTRFADGVRRRSSFSVRVTVRICSSTLR